MKERQKHNANEINTFVVVCMVDIENIFLFREATTFVNGSLC